MKHNLISILAYAEKGDCIKIISFINKIMEEGGRNIEDILVCTMWESAVSFLGKLMIAEIKILIFLSLSVKTIIEK